MKPLGEEGCEAQLEFAWKDRFVLLGDIGLVVFLPAETRLMAPIYC